MHLLGCTTTCDVCTEASLEATQQKQNFTVWLLKHILGLSLLSDISEVMSFNCEIEAFMSRVGL